MATLPAGRAIDPDPVRPGSAGADLGIPGSDSTSGPFPPFSDFTYQ
jgi:hypothetical protein